MLGRQSSRPRRTQPQLDLPRHARSQTNQLHPSRPIALNQLHLNQPHINRPHPNRPRQLGQPLCNQHHPAQLSQCKPPRHPPLCSRPHRRLTKLTAVICPTSMTDSMARSRAASKLTATSTKLTATSLTKRTLVLTKLTPISTKWVAILRPMRS